MNSNIDLSVIIVSYNQIELLENCLHSIETYNDIGERLEVIVVDNSPNMNVYDTVKVKFPWVKIIKNENTGFGAGNNLGFKNSSGKYILFLNPDTILIEPIFKFAIEKFIYEDNTVMFGVKLLNKNKKDTYSFFFVDRFGVFYSIFLRILNKLNIFISSFMHIHGADIFIRSETFQDSGMFDENIFMYDEESDLTKRIRNLDSNYRIAYYKEKKIIHLEGGSSPGVEGKYASIKRLMITEKYYCNKYNIDFNLRVKQRTSYEKMKLIILKIIHSDNVESQQNIVNLYLSYIQN